MSVVLEQALTDPPFLRLPSEAEDLLRSRNAPPRLAAHLRLVHDVAAQLTGWLAAAFPAAGFDRPAVLFGAATHDIGKLVHVEELSAPGSQHEPAGEHLLRAAGVAPELARFAGTHGSWSAPGVDLNDLLVSLADKIWKARRQTDLEQLVVDRLAHAAGQEPWQVFLTLDDHLTHVSDDADARLAFQNAYPIRAGG